MNFLLITYKALPFEEPEWVPKYFSSTKFLPLESFEALLP